MPGGRRLPVAAPCIMVDVSDQLHGGAMPFVRA